MATDGPGPPKCNKDLFERGAQVAAFETFGANAFEREIVKIREDLSVSLDWHYFGGHAIVLTYKKHMEAVKDALTGVDKEAGVLLYWL
jgi:hypothetical protein